MRFWTLCRSDGVVCDFIAANVSRSSRNCFSFSPRDLWTGWLSERFPTEVRATAAGFVYHQGAVWGAAVAPILTYFAVNQGMGFAKPMLYTTIGTTIIYIIAVYLGPETKGKVMTADLEVIAAAGD